MKTICNGIVIDLSRDDKFDKLGMQRLQESYMMPGEVSPQERFAYVCNKMGTDNSHSQRLYEYVSKHWLSLSTPILSYGKAKHGLPISCYLSYMEDTSDGLIDTLSEVNQLSMLGGGVGIGVGIRSSDNKSTGVMPHLNTYDACCLAYKQDGVRRGSYAMYLDIEHPEIIQFLEMRKPTGDHNIRCLNLHHGLNISDKFMTLIERCIEEGGKGNIIDDTWNLIDPHTKQVKATVGARDLWQRILETRMKTGEPYLCFIDTCNRGMYSFQKDLNLSIKQSNLCVAPETMILTEDGQFPIKELNGKLVKVWNGVEFSETAVVQTGTEKELLEVELSNGSTLICTPEHKFITVSTEGENGAYYGNRVGKNNNGILNATRTEAQELEKGTKLIKFDLPIIIGNTKYDVTSPYTHGFFCGDGTYTQGYHPHLSHEELEVPLNSSLKCRMEWLAGYLDADGCVSRNGTNESIKASSIQLDFLKKVQLLLVGMGVTSKISKTLKGRRKEEGERRAKTLSLSGKGGQKLYKETWEIMILSSGLYHLSEQGFETHRLKWEPCKPQCNSEHLTVVRVTRTERFDDTYCFTEPLNNAGVFNGILTGQCSEIILPTDSSRTAVCCLSSLNLECYNEWKDDKMFIQDVTEMLDNALSIFIDRAPKRIWRAKNSAQKERSIGIGVLGFHAFLQQNKIPFESEDAVDINSSIFKHIRHDIDNANIVLGALRGSPEDAKGTGRRFCCTMAVAPTATSSIIMGNTSPSVEPFRANAYRQDTMSGSFLNKNKYLKIILHDRLNDEDEDKVWSHIISNNGSVQQLPENLLTINEKQIFKTAFEIDQSWVIKHASHRQQYIDQSQSINLFIKPNVHVKELHSLHYNAWKDGLKTLYYLRSTKLADADKISSNHKLQLYVKDKICKLTNGRRPSGCLACE